MPIFPRLYIKSQVTPFVMLFAGRVGSSHLMSLLNSHPSILALHDHLGDIVNEGFETQYNWAKDVLTPPIIGRNRARGFKSKLVSLSDPQRFAQFFQERGCKILYLVRRNRIKAVVSHINGKRLYEKTGMWGLFDESNRPPAFEIDLEEFKRVLENREKVDGDLEKYVRNLNLPTLDITYEELLSNEQALVDRIFDFLKVRPMKLKAPSLKITSDNLQDVITNFSELRAHYVDTAYEAMFDEVVAQPSL